jgi:hypothetical protein
MILCVHFERIENEGEVSNSIRLEYENDNYVQSFKYSDSARELVRSIRIGEIQWQLNPIYEKYIVLENNDAFVKAMLPNHEQCECCVNQGNNRCSRCRGAWYCSINCQKKDYSNHKKWCRSHALAI